VRHAERFGSELVFETACELGLPVLERGWLVRHLRRVDPIWKLTPEQRRVLIVTLIDEAVANRTIREICMVSQDTLRRVRAKSRTGNRQPRGPVSTPRTGRNCDENSDPSGLGDPAAFEPIPSFQSGAIVGRS
jgi:hypothetical protein